MPIGSASWVQIHARYCEWCDTNGAAKRDVEALRAKWTKMLKSKPTGAGGLSAMQERFHAVETRAHLAAGGDMVGSDTDDLEAHAEGDLVLEADGIETARTHTILLRSYRSCIAALVWLSRVITS